MKWDTASYNDVIVRVNFARPESSVQYRVGKSHWQYTPFSAYEFRFTEDALNRVLIWMDEQWTDQITR